MKSSSKCILMYANDQNVSRHLTQHGQIPKNVSEFILEVESSVLGVRGLLSIYYI